MTHGGPRPGAGRKPSTTGRKQIELSVPARAALRALWQQARQNGSTQSENEYASTIILAAWSEADKEYVAAADAANE